MRVGERCLRVSSWGTKAGFPCSPHSRVESPSSLHLQSGFVPWMLLVVLFGILPAPACLSSLASDFRAVGGVVPGGRPCLSALGFLKLLAVCKLHSFSSAQENLHEDSLPRWVRPPEAGKWMVWRAKGSVFFLPLYCLACEFGIHRSADRLRVWRRHLMLRVEIQDTSRQKLRTCENERRPPPPHKRFLGAGLWVSLGIF